MKTPGLIQMLAGSSIFARVGKDKLQVLAEGASLVRLESGQHLFRMGDKAAYFFLLQAGSVVLYRPSYTGEQKVFRSMEAGDLLAETAMFAEPCRYPLSARAGSDCSIYRLPRARLLELCRVSPDFSIAMLEGMATRISQSLNRIDLLTIGNSAQRLVAYLMDLYLQQRSAWLALPASHGVLARQLNITPETFSRQLSAFRRAGFIGGRPPELVLLDADGLCQEVGLPAPDMTFEGTTAMDHLGSSLFDCCNYARQALGKG
ncbi:Crp/Fnr family transcriptional regulator [Pseudomonas sp. ABC1]|uniref:Crp/Fnr family transcriptional regulator n=1 Tax=Pseudomonas sp. ABC1 TaxID=2748080 RepID=UPI0015C3544B|nr:Crp/Fnr family transcriptional regulator [Pseudomonas sp. ABC1]QLF92536.1 Crp/Fnr family transcriptional regulator [Pseudomonas sp. ABC1]